MNSSTRVVVNTGFLYLNMLVNIFVQLIAVRLVFKALGETDYGIFNIVAGVIALFGFLNVAMSAATQRFLSFALGKKDDQLLKETFYYSVLLHILIGVIILVLLEAFGAYYIHYMLVAPPERIATASSLFHFITISTFVNIITVPYEADINANENMGAIAAINILDSLMKLAIAIVICHVGGDRLLIFGLLTMSTMILTLLIKRIYCIRKYRESHFRWHRVKDKKLLKDISTFALWNLIGAGCSIARYQGTGIILNRFFGILINASYGIAQQVNGLLNFFANTIVRAIRPQIVKSEGANDRRRMLRLATTTCKVTSLMVALLAVPMFVEMDFILNVWLNKPVQDETIMFCRAFLIIVFVYQMTIGLQIAIESVGRIRLLQIIVGSMHILALPAGYVCFLCDLPPVSIMICVLAEELISLVVRIFLAHRLARLNVWKFVLQVVLPVSLLITICVISLDYVHLYLPVGGMIRLGIVTICSTTVICFVSYHFILSCDERRVVNDITGKVLVKLKRK